MNFLALYCDAAHTKILMQCLTWNLALTLGVATLLGGCADDSGSTVVDAASPGVARPALLDAGESRDLISASVVDSAPALSAEISRCGQGPYTVVRLHARNAVPSAAGQSPVANAAITLKSCPNLKLSTNADGHVDLAMSVGAETWIRFQAPGFIPYLLGEISVPDKFSEREGVTATLVSDVAQPILLPMYKPDRPLVYVIVQMGRADAPEACRSREGVTIAVKDHPDAMILYRKGFSAMPTYAPGPGTGGDGIAIVTGISPSTSSVTVMATKVGCPYVLSYGDANAAGLTAVTQTPVQVGVVTVVAANPTR